MWRKKKSQQKATKAAVTGATGAGIVAMILTILRGQYPNLIWEDKTLDVAIVAIVMAAGTALATWVKTYFGDKKKHGDE